MANAFAPFETRLETNPRTGYFEIRWTERDATGRSRGRTYSCRTKDRAVAEQIRQTWLNAAGLVSAQSMDHTVASLIDAYVSGHIEVNSVSTSQLWALRPIKTYFGADVLADVTQPRVVAYRKARARTVKDGTIRRELGALRAVMMWAAKVGLLPVGVVLPHIDMPPPSQPKETYLEADEEQRFWDAASALALRTDFSMSRRRVGYFICIALETAARSAAIETLTWDRVNFARGLIDFREPGRKVSKKRRVPIPISDRLRPILEDLFARRDPTSRYVLDHGGSSRKSFETFRTEVGVDCTRHDLRRTWATLRAQRGVSMFDIAGVLGDNPETVAKHYAMHSPDHLRAAINAR